MKNSHLCGWKKMFWPQGLNITGERTNWFILKNNKMWKEAHLLMNSLDGNVTWWAECVLYFKKQFLRLHSVKKMVFLNTVIQGFWYFILIFARLWKPLSFKKTLSWMENGNKHQHNFFIQQANKSDMLTYLKCKESFTEFILELFMRTRQYKNKFR